MKIYKYTPHIDCFLKTSQLKITPVSHLNDPLEGNFTKSALRDYEKIFDDLLSSNGGGHNFAKLLEEAQKYKGVVSFSLKADNTLMLAYYANSHQGGFLEFTIPDDTGVGLLKNDQLIYDFGLVDYITDRPREFYINREGKDLSKDIFFQKEKIWRHEEEVRYVCDFRRCDFISVEKDSCIAKDLLEKNLSNEKRWIGKIIKKEDLDANWMMIWERLINSGELFHPLIDINKDCLTVLVPTLSDTST